MNNFDQETLALIPGDTPKQKNETLRFLLKITQEIAFPRRGTPEERRTLEDFAHSIALHLGPDAVIDQSETVSKYWSLSGFFHKMRMNPAHHLGLGDIRLSLAQQDEICELVRMRETNIRLQSLKSNQ